ncbi:MAG TPA: glycosyltransferase family 39 protein [Verrucomicrobiae bacterium]|nr:glycosyltransferase family 39 protein [Verrucomicrobiae bacterium]
MPALHRDLRLPTAIFVLALAMRLSHVADASSLPTFQHPLLDAQYHDQWAREIARGDFGSKPVFFRAPLYPYLLGLVYALLGPGPWAPKALQAILGACTCLLVASLARRIFGTRLAGLSAGTLAATSWTLIYFDGELLVEPLFVFLTLASIRAAVAARDRPSAGRLAGAGLLMGLAAVTRPTILPFPILLAPFLSGSGSRERLRAGAVFLAATAVAILPVTLHNFLRGGDRVLIASQGGVNFYIGNNPASDGTTAIVPGTRPTWEGGYEDAIRIAEASAGRSLRPSEVSRFWYAKGWEFIRGAPAAALTLTWRKSVLLWNAFEIGNNEDFEDVRSRLRLLSLPLPGFALIAPLGIAGLLLALVAPASGARPAWILAAFVAVHSAVTVAFFVNARYRLPLVAALCVGAGGAIAALAEGAIAVRRGERPAARRALTVVLVALAVAPLVAVNWYGLRPNPGVGKHLMGIAYEEAGSSEEALAEFRAAADLAQNPLAFASLTEAGKLLAKMGRDSEAEEALRRAVALAPVDLDARPDGIRARGGRGRGARSRGVVPAGPAPPRFWRRRGGDRRLPAGPGPPPGPRRGAHQPRGSPPLDGAARRGAGSPESRRLGRAGPRAGPRGPRRSPPRVRGRRRGGGGGGEGEGSRGRRASLKIERSPLDFQGSDRCFSSSSAHRA